ncbi:MAG: threonine synthase [Candidatus Aenigmatarchaeota archaeon]
MFAYGYRCFKCGENYPLEPMLYKCGCGGSLDIQYDYGEIKKELRKRKSEFFAEPPSHWKYKIFYPVSKPLVTMSEGGTPLLRSAKVGNQAGCKLFFKMESANPTGAFKDRGSSVEISKAVETRAKKVVCATTGNMGASVAAYCARAGIRAKIFVPDRTPKQKIAQIAAYGAEIKHVRGTYENAAEAAERAAANHYFLAGDYPYRGEGEKSVGFEIIEQLPQADYIVCPIGNGTLIYAVWKAVREMKICGLIKRLPKLVGVQSEGCNPVVRAFEDGNDFINPVKKPRTFADAIACGNPIDGLEALSALRESRGLAVSVNDKEILRAIKILGSEGIYAEPGGASATAGLMKIAKRDNPLEGKNVVSVVSGHGLKHPYVGN